MREMASSGSEWLCFEPSDGWKETFCVCFLVLLLIHAVQWEPVCFVDFSDGNSPCLAPVICLEQLWAQASWPCISRGAGSGSWSWACDDALCSHRPYSWTACGTVRNCTKSKPSILSGRINQLWDVKLSLIVAWSDPHPTPHTPTHTHSHINHSPTPDDS